MPEQLDAQFFSDNLNTRFRVQIDQSNTVEVELVEVIEKSYSPGQETFSVVFRGALDLAFGQGTRNIEHDRLGAFPLFMTPIARREDGMYYEAVFNRIRE